MWHIHINWLHDWLNVRYVLCHVPILDHVSPCATEAHGSLACYCTRKHWRHSVTYWHIHINCLHEWLHVRCVLCHVPILDHVSPCATKAHWSLACYCIRKSCRHSVIYMLFRAVYTHQATTRMAVRTLRALACAYSGAREPICNQPARKFSGLLHT